jgi:hypothetical protein
MNANCCVEKYNLAVISLLKRLGLVEVILVLAALAAAPVQCLSTCSSSLLGYFELWPCLIPFVGLFVIHFNYIRTLVAKSTGINDRCFPLNVMFLICAIASY